ncbi:hypothetical protein LTR84_001186 [Exophiala bonariae]|uniref:Quinate repressor protein n=1 Tax=Exophiala bonariae TaxID=1690606 RepID=A0AAV9NWE0_9EURO|nr:hypothetical protein LTR84_001186 [Exophiala bonariae]
MANPGQGQAAQTSLKRNFQAFSNDGSEIEGQKKLDNITEDSSQINLRDCGSALGPRDNRPHSLEPSSRSPTRTPCVLPSTAFAPEHQCRYDSSASILLVGFPGAGKHTLGVIVSVALRRQYVDFSAVFERDVGLAPSDFVSRRGLSAYREAENRVTRRIIEQYQKHYVIGGLTGLGGLAQRKLLQSFGTTNPVIYVQRDKQYLQGMPGSFVEQDQAYRICDAFYRSCSTVDFFNITETKEFLENPKACGTLKLKNAETDFVHFVNRIYGRVPRLLKSLNPFSPAYTYALEVSIQSLEAHGADHEILDAGADLISLIVEPSQSTSSSPQDAIVRQVATLRRHTRAPVMIEVPLSAGLNEEEYFNLLQMCMRTAPDILAIDLGTSPTDIEKLVALRGSTSIIATMHFSQSVAADRRRHLWERYHELACKYHCHAIRLTHEVTTPLENLEVLYEAQKAREKWTLPLICYNTGSAGRTSVCFNPVLSSVQEAPSSSGLTIKQAQAAVYSSFILPEKKFTILGKSVNYSLSPAFHNAAYAACGLPHSYGLLQSDDFAVIHSLLEDAQCGGITVSLPFKTQALKILDSISSEALEIGAVNTIVVHRKNIETDVQKIELEGFNTDHIGIRVCIERNISPANLVRESSTALVIGAGGMARAAIYACRTLGLTRICVFNRTEERARELTAYYNAKGMKLRVLDSLSATWPADMRQPTVVISCIPAHSIGGQEPHRINIPDHWLESRSGGVFVEVAYRPLETILIKQMQARSASGWIIVDGLDVLVEQGIAQYEIFTGRPAPVHVMRRAVRNHYDRMTRD